MRKVLGMTILSCGLISAAVLAPAGAYTVNPLKPIHETMTRLAFECYDRAVSADAEEGPRGCWTKPGRLSPIALERHSPEEVASRWPDDPTRRGSSIFTAGQWGFGVAWGCAKKIKDEAGNDRTIYEAGLLCSSHYGRLQFVHAMASAGDRGRAATLRKIYAWSAFAFDVALDRIPLDADICRTVSPRYGGKADYADLAAAFEVSPGNRCETPDGTPAMTVGQFFTYDCSRLHLPQRPCPTRAGRAARALAKRAAIGALMHLIQDSYSQSHAARPIGAVPLPPEGPFTATVVCKFPAAFFDYGAQAKAGTHGAADGTPVGDPSCWKGVVDDPVTASAMVWWKFKHRQAASELIAYFKARVFGDI